MLKHPCISESSSSSQPQRRLMIGQSCSIKQHKRSQKWYTIHKTIIVNSVTSVHFPVTPLKENSSKDFDVATSQAEKKYIVSLYSLDFYFETKAATRIPSKRCSCSLHIWNLWNEKRYLIPLHDKYSRDGWRRNRRIKLNICFFEAAGDLYWSNIHWSLTLAM